MHKAIEVKCSTDEAIHILSKICKYNCTANIFIDSNFENIDNIVLMYEPSVAQKVLDLLRSNATVSDRSAKSLSDIIRSIVNQYGKQIWEVD